MESPLEFWNDPLWRFGRKLHPEERIQRELQSLERRVIEEDESVYADYPLFHPTSVAKELALETLDRRMPRLESYRGGIHELVMDYDAGDATLQESTVARLADQLFGSWVKAQEPALQREYATALQRFVKAHLDGRRKVKRDGQLHRMDNGIHAQDEHPLNVAHRLTRWGKKVPLAWYVTALMHDHIEDVEFKLQQGSVEEIIAQTEAELSVLGEGLSDATRQQVEIGVRAIELVTLRRTTDYELELEHLEHLPPQGDNPLVTAAAYATKLNDKGSAVVTTDYLGEGPFGPELLPLYPPLDEMAQFWKALSIGNLQRKSQRAGALTHVPPEQQQLIAEMSGQAALDLWKTITTQLRQQAPYLEEMHTHIGGAHVYWDATAANERRCNAYIRNGGITRIDTGNHELTDIDAEFGNLFFFLRLHKMDPKHKKLTDIPGIYRLSHQERDDLINHLDRDLARFKGEFPYTSVQRFYRHQLTLGEQRLRELREELPLYRKVDKHLRSLRQAAQRFALNTRTEMSV